MVTEFVGQIICGIALRGYRGRLVVVLSMTSLIISVSYSKFATHDRIGKIAV